MLENSSFEVVRYFSNILPLGDNLKKENYGIIFSNYYNNKNNWFDTFQGLPIFVIGVNFAMSLYYITNLT